MNEGDKWSSGACVTDRAARWPIASEERVEERGRWETVDSATRTYGPVGIINLSEGTRSRQAGEGGAGWRGGAGRGALSQGQH